MNLTKHKKWVTNYMKKNHSCTPVLATEINVDTNCNLIIESWDSRMNIWKDQVPLHCKINGKSCGLCTESNSCPFYRNRLLIDKAKAIVK